MQISTYRIVVWHIKTLAYYFQGIGTFTALCFLRVVMCAHMQCSILGHNNAVNVATLHYESFATETITHSSRLIYTGCTWKMSSLPHAVLYVPAGCDDSEAAEAAGSCWSSGILLVPVTLLACGSLSHAYVCYRVLMSVSPRTCMNSLLKSHVLMMESLCLYQYAARELKVL